MSREIEIISELNKHTETLKDLANKLLNLQEQLIQVAKNSAVQKVLIMDMAKKIGLDFETLKKVQELKQKLKE